MKNVKPVPRVEEIERAIEKFYLREAAAGGDKRTSAKARTLARKYGRKAKGDR